MKGQFKQICEWLVWVGLALVIALVSGWHVRQWQVPKAWARQIFLGCRAVGIRRQVFIAY